MSSKVDDRIVNMKFNNAQFEKGVADTSKSLETLKKGLSLKDGIKGIGDLAGAIKGVSMDGLSNGVQTLASKFSALGVVGLTALANIANKAVDAGLQLAKSLTIDPVKAGLDEYELKMGSIQTILANTSRYGTSLEEVTSNLDELNKYADKTIYNFGDMTKNIGLFTNAGLRIEDATSMIKGFSNEAAASGTSAQGAAGAAYQLSQALSAGTIRLMDWRSLTNVGMGNKNMQNGLIEIADAMGVLEKSSIKATDIQKDFNGSLEKNWLSADVMSSYLKIMAGDMTAAEQAALGLSDAQIAAFAKQAKTAEDAATKVRTWTQLVGTLQEGVGSGWAQTFDILIGDFDQATELWTAVSEELGSIVGDMSDARNELLQGFVDEGGRDALLKAFGDIWQAFKMFVMPIKSAFTEIFPPITAKNLANMAKEFGNFAKSLQPSAETMKLLRRTAMGLFAIFDIGWTVIQQIIGLFGRLFGAVAPASGGILEMTANIGDWLVSVRDAIKNGEGLTKVFEWLAVQGEKVIGFFSKAGEVVGNTLSVDGWAQAWENVANAIKSVWEWMQPFFDWVGQAFQTVKKAVQDFFSTLDFNVLVGALNVGLLGGVFLLVRQFLKKLPDMFSGIGGGILDTIKGAFGSLTDTMEAMQTKLKAEALTKIAIAIGILTAAVVALSFVDTPRLVASLGAMTVMFGQLAGIMVVMDKSMKAVSPVKMGALSASMTLLAGAMVLMASAVAIMAQLEWDELARGLVGMAGSLGIMIGATALLNKMQADIVRGAASILIMSTAMAALGGALKIFATMNWDDIVRSLVLLAGSLMILIEAMRLAGSSAQGAAAMFIISAALTVLGSALLIMAKLSWDEIIRALATLGGSLLLMSIGVKAMEGSIRGAGAMLIVTAGIIALAGAFKIFATLSWDEIVRSLVAMGGGLAILAGAMALMGIPLVMAGSVGILASAAAMMMLAPALVLLGTMSWDAIGRGLTMLGASLAILAVGGLLMIPASVGFVLLGAAMLAIGTGALLAGTGMALFATGFLALAGSAALGAEAIKMALTSISEMIPTMMAAFAQGLIDFALVIAGGAVEFTAAMTTLLQSLIDAIGNVGPQVIETLWGLLMLMATKLEQNVPILVEKGGNLIIGVLNGMRVKIPGIAKAGTDLMIALMQAISREVPRLADEGAKAIIKLVNGISDSIDRNAAAMGRAGGRLAASIIRGMVNGIGAGIGEIVNAARNMAENALNAAKNFLGINSPSKEFMKIGMGVDEGMELGIDKYGYLVDRAAENMGQNAMNAMKSTLSDMKNAVAMDPNLSPTIKPVLDLTAIKKEASRVPGILTPPALKLDNSVAYASQAQMAGYAAQESANQVEEERMLEARGGDVIFNQTNNSPKALTNAEIYRKTNNQLSVAKKELTTADA